MAILATIASMGRGKHNVALGDGGNPDLALAIRRFGNLSEYAAMVLLLMLLMEIRGVSAQWLHVFGLTLLALRLIHPVALFEAMDAPVWKKAARFVAGAGTALLLVAGAAVLLVG